MSAAIMRIEDTDLSDKPDQQMINLSDYNVVVGLKQDEPGSDESQGIFWVNGETEHGAIEKVVHFLLGYCAQRMLESAPPEVAEGMDFINGALEAGMPAELLAEFMKKHSQN